MIRFSIGVPPNLSFAAYGRLAALIERYAFSLLIVDDVPHFVSCWGILFFLAQQTRRVQLGPSVTHPYLRHPLLTAANVAALDELSGGRAFLGLGRGDSFHHQALHTPMPRPVRALREAVALIRQALAGGKEGFRGEVFQVEPSFGLAFTPRRAQVPIYLGTTGPVGFRLVGEIADGAHSPALLAPAAVTMARENIEAGARASGRDAALLDVAASCWASLGGDRRLALRRAKEELLRHLPDLAGLSQAA
ncbi:MAG: LLM class flavin-dependent oxidoreductase [Candidatus Tectomicrobia bacterium]|nr:LLM class flavin-dependent oxidoreductase [Candidatus Tectomicrobia bacterium]